MEWDEKDCSGGETIKFLCVLRGPKPRAFVFFVLQKFFFGHKGHKEPQRTQRNTEKEPELLTLFSPFSPFPSSPTKTCHPESRLMREGN